MQVGTTMLYCAGCNNLRTYPENFTKSETRCNTCINRAEIVNKSKAATLPARYIKRLDQSDIIKYIAAGREEEAHHVIIFKDSECLDYGVINVVDDLSLDVLKDAINNHPRTYTVDILDLAWTDAQILATYPMPPEVPQAVEAPPCVNCGSIMFNKEGERLSCVRCGKVKGIMSTPCPKCSGTEYNKLRDTLICVQCGKVSFTRFQPALAAPPSPILV